MTKHRLYVFTVLFAIMTASCTHVPELRGREVGLDEFRILFTEDKVLTCQIVRSPGSERLLFTAKLKQEVEGADSIYVKATKADYTEDLDKALREYCPERTVRSSSRPPY